MLILLLIFIGNELIRYLHDAAKGKLLLSVMFHTLLLEVPYFVGLLLPIGLFFSIILVLSRLYADNEMVVMFASGLARKQYFAYLSIAISITAIFSFIIVLGVSPGISKQLDIIKSGRVGDSVLAFVQPGRFEELLNHNVIVYASSVGKHKKQVNHFFMAEKPSHHTGSALAAAQGWSIVSAKGVKQVIKADGSRYIVAVNGRRYQGVPGRNRLLVTSFKEYGVKIPPLPQSFFAGDESTKSTGALLLSSRYSVADMAELQWRISLPIAVFILGLMAIPFGRTSPRRSRYATLLPAILCCMLYVNLLFVARSCLSLGMISPWLGMWPVHVLALLCILLWMRYGSRKGGFA